MINPKELRIGNFVKAYSDGGFTIITNIIIENTCWDYIEPIHITEEWLLRFGFEFSSELKVFGKTYQNPHYTNYGDWYIFKDRDNDFRIKFMRTDGFFDESTVYFKYVHQFQNLYFALTSEELTVK